MKTSCLIAFICTAFAICGCSAPEKQQKTVITLFSDGTHQYSALETLVESTCPDIDLQLEFQYTNQFASEVNRRFSKGLATDLLIVSQFSENAAAGNLLDLSGYGFCALYEKTIMDNIRNDGKIHALPLTGYYYGQLYNRTLFEEYGITMPKTNAELIAAAKKLTAAGINSNYGSSFGIKKYSPTDWGAWVFGYAVPDFLSTVEGIRWYDDFCNKKTGMEGVWEPLFRSIYTFVEEKVLIPEAIDPMRKEALDMEHLITGKIALGFLPSFTPDMLAQKNREAYEAGEADALYEYGMLPFFTDGGRPAWTMTTPRRYIAVNAAMNNPENAKKKDACVRILELVSTAAGQKAIAESVSGSISYLGGVKLDENAVPAGLEDAAAAGRVYAVKLPGNAAEVIGSAVSKLILGKLTVEQCTREIDRRYFNPTAQDEYALTVVGALSNDAIWINQDVRYRETELGNLVADSVRELSGARIAVANGGAIRASLYAGDITGADLQLACPYDNKIVVLEMDGATVRAMLENGVSTLFHAENKYGGRFLQISGASYVFDSSKPAGERIRSVRLADGSPLADNGRYTVAVSDYMAGARDYDEQGNGDGFTMLNVYSDSIPRNKDIRIVQETEKTCLDALAAYFENHKDTAISVTRERRILDEGYPEK